MLVSVSWCLVLCLALAKLKGSEGDGIFTPCPEKPHGMFWWFDEACARPSAHLHRPHIALTSPSHPPFMTATVAFLLQTGPHTEHHRPKQRSLPCHRQRPRKIGDLADLASQMLVSTVACQNFALQGVQMPMAPDGQGVPTNLSVVWLCTICTAWTDA